MILSAVQHPRVMIFSTYVLCVVGGSAVCCHWIKHCDWGAWTQDARTHVSVGRSWGWKPGTQRLHQTPYFACVSYSIVLVILCLPPFSQNRFDLLRLCWKGIRTKVLAAASHQVVGNSWAFWFFISVVSNFCCQIIICSICGFCYVNLLTYFFIDVWLVVADVSVFCAEHTCRTCRKSLRKFTMKIFAIRN